MPDQERTPKTSALNALAPLDIAFVTTRFGHQFGGAEAYGVELMRELSKRHRITVIGYEYDPHSALKLSFIPVHINNRLPSWIRSYLFAKKERIQLGNRLLIRSEEHTSELQSRGHLVCRLLLEKKK